MQPNTTLPDAASTPSGPAGIVAAIREIHAALAAAPSLRPGSHVDGLFRRLVRLAVSTPADDAVAVLADPGVQAARSHLVELCARGEHRLEQVWADRIACSRLPDLTLARFPYLDNYRQLTDLERSALTGHTRRPLRRALFVGSGALPLSSLFHARHFDLPIDNLDRDPTAVAAGRVVAHRLSGPRRIGFHHGDLATHDDLTRYDLVILAALVGLTADQKRRHLHHLHRAMPPGALLLARSAHGLRTLLYPTVDPADLSDAGWDLLAVTHPAGPVINSVVVARNRPGGDSPAGRR